MKKRLKLFSYLGSIIPFIDIVLIYMGHENTPNYSIAFYVFFEFIKNIWLGFRK